jgi:hypothetical protein
MRERIDPQAEFDAALGRLPDVQKDKLRDFYGRRWRRTIRDFGLEQQAQVFAYLRAHFPPGSHPRSTRGHPGRYATVGEPQALQFPMDPTRYGPGFPTVASVRAWIRNANELDGKRYRSRSIRHGGPRSRFWHVRQFEPSGLPFAIKTLPDGVQLVMELHSRT